LHTIAGKYCIILDNQLLNDQREEGLFLHLNKLIKVDKNNQRLPLKTLSTSKVFAVTDNLLKSIGKAAFENKSPQNISNKLVANLFHFKRNISDLENNAHNLEHNLIRYMPQIVTSDSPHLIAAQINTQIEFDRTFIFLPSDFISCFLDN